MNPFAIAARMAMLKNGMRYSNDCKNIIQPDPVSADISGVKSRRSHTVEPSIRTDARRSCWKRFDVAIIPIGIARIAMMIGIVRSLKRQGSLAGPSLRGRQSPHRRCGGDKGGSREGQGPVPPESGSTNLPDEGCHGNDARCRANHDRTASASRSSSCKGESRDTKVSHARSSYRKKYDCRWP